MGSALWPNSEDDEVWKHTLADFLWQTWRRLAFALSEWHRSFTRERLEYVATWLLGVAFRSADGKGIIGRFDIVNAVQSCWEPRLKDVFNNHLAVIGFCDGFQASKDLSLEPPSWVEQALDLEQEMCIGEPWSMRDKLGLLEWRLTWGNGERVARRVL